MRFQGKTALVTGAASGIGLAIAELLSAEGAETIRIDKADGGGSLVGDVTDEAFWARFDHPPIDLAVINAGVSGSGMIADLDFAEWRRILSVNLDGAFLTLRHAMRTIRDGGAIVLVGSAAGVKAEPGIAAYAASKAAVLQLTRVAAKEGASRRIRVNAIAPGGVQTPIWRGIPFFDDIARRDGEQAAFDRMASFATPLGRYATADEIAGQIAFLLSDSAATMTGAVLLSDGGYTL
ncbi:NAD(P)-dependent dehydrogenase (short-subunit alcohol dehydrogenase family) [Sphingomonas jejuensis]|uniref:NAD(P)-dependent dehydrogenase (Short-subunit alcohol dehydrogenase family) n=1 Tax=Sphingomonas jejuensis TaxID=904715 RepID=A0ABX0XLH7_9SPHN|nr:SDR family oxidoreductase [Sphingomonas jejuensis]NJC34084.1 NAD(P)-dependent dehydrogenase (short-subunit alcohol dehydrogenase family) [Sphingomonas jejuensis]